MMFESVKEITDAVKPACHRADRSRQRDERRRDPATRRSAGMDRGVRRGRRAARARPAGSSAAWPRRPGIRPASIHDLYMAMGRGEAGGFTVPAINVRAMAYDTARAVIRAAKKLERRRVHLRDRALGDRLHRAAAARVRRRRAGARRCARASRGPLFIQGDHVQTNAKKYNSPDRDKELDDAARADPAKRSPPGFYNIDIDTSTLVDLDKPTLAEQQEVNVDAGRRLRGVHPRAASRRA